MTSSTRTRPSCGAAGGYRAPLKSPFLPSGCELHGYHHFALASPAPPARYGADKGDHWVPAECAVNGEAFLMGEKKRHSPLVPRSLAFQKHLQNRLKGAACCSQSRRWATAAPWHRKPIHTARTPAPEMENCLWMARERSRHHSTGMESEIEKSYFTSHIFLLIIKQNKKKTIALTYLKFKTRRTGKWCNDVRDELRKCME